MFMTHMNTRYISVYRAACQGVSLPHDTDGRRKSTRHCKNLALPATGDNGCNRKGSIECRWIHGSDPKEIHAIVYGVDVCLEVSVCVPVCPDEGFLAGRADLPCRQRRLARARLEDSWRAVRRP